jgi:hypothetical protein
LRAAIRVAGREPRQHVSFAAAGDHRICAAVRRALGGENLGQHAAAAETGARTARHGFEFRRTGIGLLDKRCGRILAWIGGEKPLLIGEDDERIPLDQIRDQRTQRVVVPELDFVGNNRVVLVDDRHDTQTKQGE